MERLVKRLSNKLVQVPVQGLKGAAWNHSSAILDNFVRAVNGELDLPFNGKSPAVSDHPDSTRHVLITRTPKDCLELQGLLEDSSIRLRPFPVLRLAEHTDRRGWQKVTKLLEHAALPHPWLTLTSPRAARFLVEQARERRLETIFRLRTAAIGAATAEAADAAGLQVEIVGQGTGIDLARKLNELWTEPTKAILAAGVRARPELPLR